MIEMLNDVKLGLEAVENGIGITDSGIISKLIDNAYIPEHKANEFLSQQASKNGIITEDDIEKAATIYSAYKMKKAYINVYKTKKKADALIKGKQIDATNQLDGDWFSAFEDHVSKITDESILDMWAGVLAGKILKIGTFRKIMLDRLALLDAQSIKTFTELCTRTYNFSLSNGQEFKIPFYISQTEISEMDKFKSSKLTEEELYFYKCDLPEEADIQILEEIGLVKFGEDFETTDFYDDVNLSFLISVAGEKSIVPFSIKQKEIEYYQSTWNGSVMYTAIGMELYKILSTNYQPNDCLMPVVKKYNEFLKCANTLQKKQEWNPLFRLKKNKTYVFL